MPKSHALVTLICDGCLFRATAGWGSVFRSRRGVWVGFGRSDAETSDDAEFFAVRSAVRAGIAHELIQDGCTVRVVSDSKRVISALSGKAIPMYCSDDWRKLRADGHVLGAAGVALRGEILDLLTGLPVNWRWMNRNSTPDLARADALARIGAGDVSRSSIARAGLASFTKSELNLIGDDLLVSEPC